MDLTDDEVEQRVEADRREVNPSIPVETATWSKAGQGQLLVVFHGWTFLLGPQFCAGFGNGILLGYLMYRSELVPRRMALLGLIGGPLAFIGGVFVLFGAFDQPSGPLIALTAIEKKPPLVQRLSCTKCRSAHSNTQRFISRRRSDRLSSA